MPYIPQKRRADIGFLMADMQTTGELNYVITEVLNEYISLHELSYSVINDIIGALEGAKLEFYRRVAVPYEDKKRNENGDVY